MAAKGSVKEVAKSSPVKTNIRRYYCPYCGIGRSKKALIASHVASQHEDESSSSSVDNVDNQTKAHKGYACEECGATFRKPAYLKQHMQGHSIERPFSCPVDDCRCSYQRKDHLTRHLCSHQGKLFTCPQADCNRQFVFQANMKRHITKCHTSDKPCGLQGKLFTCPLANCSRQFALQANMKRHISKYHTLDKPCDVQKTKWHTCSEAGCGKSFKYLSKLKKHQESHERLDSVETICSEPGCTEYFSNAECMKAHLRSCHSRVLCPDCGTYQLKKNLKRHQRIHEDRIEEKTLKCSYDGCSRMFTNKSNLNVHIKAFHLQRRPFTCRISGCGMKFTFRHVRDNHEKSNLHTYVRGDFLEADLVLRSRSRGGRKRKFEGAVDMLLRKRVALPHVLDNASEYLRWLLGGDQE